MYCSHCGARHRPEARFCPRCGAALLVASARDSASWWAGDVEEDGPFLPMDAPDLSVGTVVPAPSADRSATVVSSPPPDSAPFWEVSGFKASVAAGTLVTPIALLFSFSQFADIGGGTPSYVPWVMVVLGSLMTWVVLALLHLGMPRSGTSLRPYWSLLLGVIAGSLIGALLLFVLLALALATSDKGKRRR